MKYRKRDISVNEVLEILDKKFDFLKGFDDFVSKNINKHIKRVEKNNQVLTIKKLNTILTNLFQEFILTQQTGIVTKNGVGVSFVDTGLMVSTIIVKYIE